MRIPILAAIALATLTATASAQQPVTQFDPVGVNIAISDAGGTITRTLSCEWTEPEADDMPCIRFQGDPQTAFAAIVQAGGVRADQTTTTVRGNAQIAYSKRADGTWLVRSHATIDGRDMHFGRVCTADGQHCVRWDVGTARSAKRAVANAARKLR